MPSAPIPSSPDREASFKHHGKEYTQHRCDCNSTIVAGVCPFASLEDRVYDPSAQALRNFNQQKMRKGDGYRLQQHCLCIKKMLSSDTINACGLVPAQPFES